MAGVHENRAGKTSLVERLDGLTLEANPLVALQDRLMIAPIASGDAAIALADRSRNMGDFKAAGFARVRGTAERIKRLQEKRTHEIRLKPPSLSFFYLFFDRKKSLGSHCFLCER